MLEITIRRAGANDIESIALLAAKIFDDSRISELDVYYVAEVKRKDAEEIVGFVHLIEKPEKIVLQGIGVDEKFRNAGIGTKLLDAALAYCEQSSAAEVVLKVRALNPAANLYLSHGFFAKQMGDVLTLVRKKPN